MCQAIDLATNVTSFIGRKLLSTLFLLRMEEKTENHL